MKYSSQLQQAVNIAEEKAIQRFLDINGIDRNGNIPYTIEHIKRGPYVSIIVKELCEDTS
jgi:hypothetical protein